LLKRSALLLAAGQGKRVGGDIPKQYMLLDKHAIIWHSLVSLGSCNEINEICTVIAENDIDLFESAIVDIPENIKSKLLSPVLGGAERQDSVRNGLEYLDQLDPPPNQVFIHDAARPFVSKEIILKLCSALDSNIGAVPAIRVSDSIKKVKISKNKNDSRVFSIIKSSIDRSDLWLIQTPQAFYFDEIIKAHRTVKIKNFTDDAGIIETLGKDVIIIDGDPKNFKITNPKDLNLAKNSLSNINLKNKDLEMPEINQAALQHRVGMGFDVHRFGSGDGLIVCGIHIPFEKGVEAHSDGDVAIHALVDAILGALGSGDIGTHFPPGEDKWHGISSSNFLTHAINIMHEKNGKLINADITIICERPKISIYREQMIKNISSITGYSKLCFSIKGTTTEKLGFTGRGEGIAAHAIVSIEIPDLDCF
tara:strand:+ start:1635 stop:2900 length:1266 start_codon:yes stop_codon:yes gene_type:complete